MDGPRVTLCTNGFHGVRFRFQETFLYLGGLTSEVTVTNTVMSSPQQVGILSFSFLQSIVLNFLGEYSCLQVDLMFARQLSFFIVTVYIPCSMTVSVSWMSFWLDHKAVSSPIIPVMIYYYVSRCQQGLLLA